MSLPSLLISTLEKYGKVNTEFSRFTPFIWDIETLATGEVVIVSPGLTIYVCKRSTLSR
jgi:hypothetical protein